MNIISKEEAKLLNQKWYFTGKPCKNGHVDKRYVNTDICYECKRIQNKGCNKRNPDTLKSISKRTYDKNRLKKLKSSKIWVINNREKSNKIKSNWKIKHREKYLKYCREYQINKRSNPYNRLCMNMSKAIWECLKNKKNHLTWLKYVNYTLSDLIKHLENKFTSEMTWDNYGIYWHIDHVKPLSWFDLEKEFDDAWALSNLQPLEAFKNLSKGNKFIG